MGLAGTRLQLLLALAGAQRGPSEDGAGLELRAPERLAAKCSASRTSSRTTIAAASAPPPKLNSYGNSTLTGELTASVRWGQVKGKDTSRQADHQ